MNCLGYWRMFGFWRGCFWDLRFAGYHQDSRPCRWLRLSTFRTVRHNDRPTELRGCSSAMPSLFPVNMQNVAHPNHCIYEDYMICLKCHRGGEQTVKGTWFCPAMAEQACMLHAASRDGSTQFIYRWLIKCCPSSAIPGLEISSRVRHDFVDCDRLA